MLKLDRLVALGKTA